MRASRIANVTAARWIGSPRVARSAAGGAALARVLDALFEEVLTVDRVADAIATAVGERVLVARDGDPRVTPELLLALVAWPERAAVCVFDPSGGEAPCAIYRREDLIARAEDAGARSAAPPDLLGLAAGLDLEQVSLERLGLDGPARPLFAWREGP